jgi:hypothetical protein
MLQNFIDLVRTNASQLQSPLIPAERKDEAVTLAGTSIYDGIKTSLSGGGVTNVMNFFKGGDTNLLSNPVGQGISANFISKFSSAFGMNTTQASGLASAFLPGVLTTLISRANDPTDKTFNMQTMFDQFSGGATSKFDITSMFAKVKSGLDRDGDGDVDFQDLKAMFSGTDGIVDKIKNVFK